ncbi:molybdate ABC transporter substrate-binding protein [Georgenia phoenicis]|uniref:molybdate ABC transporter substrate-binding protein n=1 Tax=unclassified Georgenia TaxID=2626815 RepID=UPI0039B0DEDB
MTRRRLVACAAALTLALTGCGGDDGGEQLTVFAASSLGIPFSELGREFAEQHPDVELRFSWAGSSDLVSQVLAGAPADVLATADERTMDDVVAAGLVAGEPTVVAENVLSLITPAGNPAGVTGLDDSLDGADLVVCAPQVPCGAATVELAERLGVTLTPVSELSQVTDVLAKVATGQADAGLVYASGAALGGDDVDVIPVPGAEDVVNRYPVAVLADAGSRELADAWMELVSGPQGQAAFRDAGFSLP